MKYLRCKKNLNINIKIFLVILCFTFSEGVFFRYQILNNFTGLFSDTYEGFIELSILEHWNNFFHGSARWNVPNYFYPDTDSLGYNDGYLIYGLIHYLFRFFGVPLLLSGELVNIVVRGVGFLTFYCAARKILSLSYGWSLFGAVLFTLCNNVYIQMIHQQLLSVSFAPGLAILLQNSWLSLRSARRLAFLSWGTSFILLHIAWMMTAYYMAWFFSLFCVVLLVSWHVLADKAERGIFWGAARAQRVPLTALAVLLAVALVPFCLVYVPKADLGMRSYAEALSYTPSVFDIFHVGDGNLVYGELDGALQRYLYPGADTFTEKTSGFPLILVALFSFAVVWPWREKGGDGRKLLLTSLAATSVITWVAILHFGSWSAYYLIYHLIPGARAIRAVARYQIFLDGPVVALVCVFLAHHSRHLPKAASALLCCVLIAEQINSRPVLRINRAYWQSWLDSVPSPPQQCEAFYVVKDLPLYYAGPYVDGIYHHSVDAMMIAEIIHLPTINGFSSVLPPGYDLFNPAESTYPERVTKYAANYRIKRLCGLDLTTMQWTIP